MVNGQNQSNAGRNPGNRQIRPNQQNQQNQQNRGVRVVYNHNIDHQLIRDLLGNALDPLVVDPIPTRVVLHNIDIRRTVEGEVSISCEVLYETESP